MAEAKKQATPSNTAVKLPVVDLKNGKLAIAANGSELTQILRAVAGLSGTTIHGISTSTRIYGTYGPGNPWDVLTGLLTGSAYNFVMVGHTADGMPREILLTVRTEGDLGLAPANPPPDASGDGGPAQPNQNTAAPEAIPPAAEDTQDTSDSTDPQDSFERDRRVQQNLQRLELEQQSTQDAPQ